MELAYSTRDRTWSLWKDDQSPAERVTEKDMLINSKYDGRCRSCGNRWKPGDQIAWDPATRATFCKTCVDNQVPKAVAAAQAAGLPPIETSKGQKTRPKTADELEIEGLEARQQDAIRKLQEMRGNPAHLKALIGELQEAKEEIRQRIEEKKQTWAQVNRATEPFWASIRDGGKVIPDSWVPFLNGPPPTRRPAARPSAPPAQSKLVLALRALEEAILEKAGATLTPEMEKAWTRYQKLKTVAERPGSSNEGQTALRLALIEAVKLAF